MKITFLGTGAADWKMEEHKHLEGFRRNASALIDDCLLIDPGPCVEDALCAFGKNREDIKYIINTHKHWDHYDETTISNLPSAQFYEISAGDSITLGSYIITAYKANHSNCEEAVHFIISDGEKKLFYALDGAWLMFDESFAIRNTTVDYAVFDATIGNVDGDHRVFVHNNLNMVLEMKKSLEKHIKRFCISHMARTLHDSQQALESQMKKYGVEVAFDGYETEF